MNSQPSATFDDPIRGEISLADFLSVLLVRKWLIIAGAVVGFGAGVGYGFTRIPLFTAEVLIAPAQDGGGKGGLSALAGQFGGLAALAGVNIGGGGGNRSEAVATLNSRALTEIFLQENRLLPVLFDTRWDEDAKTFKGEAPTLWDGEKMFRGIRSISDDKKTGLISLAIEWKDPVLAARWANALVKLANQSLRDRAIADSTRNLDYLNAQLEKTSVVELRQTIYRLLETEVKNIMVAQGSTEYAFKVIDPAVVPQEKSKPKRTFLAAVGALFGGMFAVLYVVLARNRSAE